MWPNSRYNITTIWGERAIVVGGDVGSSQARGRWAVLVERDWDLTRTSNCSEDTKEFLSILGMIE